MDKVTILPPETMGNHFIEPQYLPEGQDDNYLRNQQSPPPPGGWRHLHSDEVERLVKNDNTAHNWDDILVTNQFDPKMIKNNKFYGTVRIGAVRNVILQHHDLRLAAGITNSLIISCDIGNDVAIHDVHYLAHYIIGDNSILFNIQEMNTTDHAKFGNGIVKDGEPESVRTWLEIMNETASRKVLPFDGMIPADAYLWGKYIEDAPLQANLKRITQESMDSRRGYFGTTGRCCVIKNCSIVKDVKIGSHCYIKGASKLKNITINSSEQEPTQIGEGIVLVNGIVGYGCHIFYNCIAVRFILGNNSNLKYGARLINSFLGDNSTISCCEVLNNLIFPAHEQHHNNSFLVAAVVMGQSNLAAGATLGSNHNSRSNDNEIQAGRGFWPGLCTSVKHSCRFASFTLLSKADYPAEMDIPLPFSLLNNNTALNCLEVIPAFWWLYNMYALARNGSKYLQRDKRIHKDQHVEFDAFAPDTAEELLHGLHLLEVWTAKAWLRSQGVPLDNQTEDALAAKGRELLNGPQEVVDSLEILGENMEKGHRKVHIHKVWKAWRAYRDMLYHYGTRNLISYITQHPEASLADMHANLGGAPRVSDWVNLGGQLMPTSDLDKLRQDIGQGRLNTWAAIHKRYDDLWERYPLDKQRHAYAVLSALMGVEKIDVKSWPGILDKAIELQDYICEQVYDSRHKDYDNHFRQITFKNEAEMLAAVGTIEDNSFIVQVREETAAFKNLVNTLKQRR
ncbi:MAG: DUF4954 family protein [Bacteroidales bacterium]|nr:DUF4954 family protein [Bacteroidales bacterium]